MIFAKTSITTKDKNKLRGVWGKPFSALILEHIMYRRWITEVAQKSESIPTAFRYTMYHRGWYRLFNDLSKYGKRSILCLDFSKYDTSLAPWLLRIGHNIWTSNILFTPPEKKVANTLFKETIDTTFIMPDGHVYQKNGGTDSGSLGFQRDEDVCTSIMVNYGVEEQGRHVVFYSVLGDDSICVLESDVPLDMERLVRVIYEKFGVVVNPEKSQQVNDVSKARFLGRYVNNGYPLRDTAELVLSMIYPRQADVDDFDVAQRIVALMFENCYANPYIKKYLEQCWMALPEEVQKACFFKEIPWKPKAVRMFFQLGIKPPPFVVPPSEDQVFLLLNTEKGSGQMINTMNYFTNNIQCFYKF